MTAKAILAAELCVELNERAHCVGERGAQVGLFSGLKGKGLDAELDRQTAIMVPVLAAVMADGEASDDEIGNIRSICAWSPIYSSNTRDRDSEIILRAHRLVQDYGIDEMCRKAAAVLSPGLCETAFSFAARIVFADGHVGAGEQKTLEAIVPLLGLSEARAMQIVEVVSIIQHTIDA